MPQTVPQTCACGSGLSPARCCATPPADMPTPAASWHLAPLEQQAMAAHAQGDLATAERLAIGVLELAPARIGALSVLYQLRKDQGARPAAEALLRRIVAIEPNNFPAQNELTVALLTKGATEEAARHARDAVRIAPTNPQAHNLLGMAMTEAQRPQDGEYHYTKVLELSGRRDPVVLANLAWNLKSQGRMQEARALYQESLAAAPAIRQTLLGWARLEEADRDFDAANALLDRAEALFPSDPALLLTRAVLLGRTKHHAQALAMLDRLAEQTPDGHLGPNELAEKGRLLDQMGRHDDAWAAFTDAKRRARELSGSTYPDAAVADIFARLGRFFTAERLLTLPRAAARADTPQPVFVLGFPRSGTTLIEQTLSAHPAIAAGDELPLINDLTALLPRMLASPLQYPEALSELWMADQRHGLDTLRDHYLQKAAQIGAAAPGAARFTDKMPLNETHLGLIALIFPKAPLLHVVRHPLDVMVSAMANHFTHGLFCGSSLETAARHYVRVMDLVDQYRSQMDLPYMRVRYEDMVDDQEPTVRAILAFIGEPFDPACLDFHENRRYARTASYAQVSERLYDRSRFRYRNYLRHLEPVLPVLRPVIERLGYTV